MGSEIVEPAITEGGNKQTYLILDMGQISKVMLELDKKLGGNGKAYEALGEEFMLLHGKSRIAGIAERSERLNRGFKEALKGNYDDLLKHLNLKVLLEKNTAPITASLQELANTNLQPSQIINKGGGDIPGASKIAVTPSPVTENGSNKGGYYNGFGRTDRLLVEYGLSTSTSKR